MILGLNFHISFTSLFSEIRPGNDVWRWCRGCTRSSLPYMEISNFDGGHLGFFGKGFTHDFGSQCHVSFKSVYGLIRPGNDVWRWCRVCTRSSLPYMEISNFDGGHLGFFGKGFTHDLGSKCHISFKSVYSEIRPGNDVWRWCRVCTRSFTPYMEISNFDGGYLGFFSKWFTHDFGSQCHVSFKSVYGLIRPGNDVWRWCRVCTRSS